MSGQESPGRSSSDYYGSSSAPSQADIQAQVAAMLASMPQEVRQQLEQLAKADENTRRAALEACDAKIRTNIEFILQFM